MESINFSQTNNIQNDADIEIIKLKYGGDMFSVCVSNIEWNYIYEDTEIHSIVERPIKERLINILYDTAKESIFRGVSERTGVADIKDVNAGYKPQNIKGMDNVNMRESKEDEKLKMLVLDEEYINTNSNFYFYKN